jgi:hypothetical protein
MGEDLGDRGLGHHVGGCSGLQSDDVENSTDRAKIREIAMMDVDKRRNRGRMKLFGS